MYNNSNRNSKRCKKTHHNNSHYHHQRPSLPSLHQIFPSPPLQVSLPPFISLNPLPYFSEMSNELYPECSGYYNSIDSDEQTLENASLFFFGNNTTPSSTTPPKQQQQQNRSHSNNNKKKRRDFILFDPRDYPPTSSPSFKGKLVPDLGSH